MLLGYVCSQFADNHAMQNQKDHESTPPNSDDVSSLVNPQKQRKGISRIMHAGGYSIAGLKAGWQETAFRQEAVMAIFLLPVSFWLGEELD